MKADDVLREPDNWDDLPEEEQEFLVASEMNEFEGWLATLDLRGEIRERAALLLESCTFFREDAPYDLESRGYLRACQVSLARLRAWRETGHRPGNA